MRTLACSVVLLAGTAPLAVAADYAPPPQIRNNFGSVGLLDMPSARMAPDGELAMAASFFRDTQHYSLNFQFLPWLETSFRYSGLSHFDPVLPVYYDRSFAVKARLFNEGDLLPAISVGVNDIVGTGIYSGEYIVASKQFGDVDTTLGMGWGRLGTANTFRNPLSLISNSFKNRPSELLQIGGQFNFSQYFHGPTSGVFAGASWRTPVEGLTLVGEYSSDAYALEASRRMLKPKNQFNIGASYLIDKSVQVGVNWMYGTTLGLNLALQFDPRETYTARISPPIPQPKIRSQRQQQQAIDSIVNPRSPVASANATLAWQRMAGKSGGINNNALVDKLLSADDYADVAIRGRTLVLTTSRDASQSHCREAAAVLQSYNADFDAIVMRAGAGKHSPTVHCNLAEGAFAQPAVYRSPADAGAGDEAGGDPQFPASNSAAIKLIRADVAKQKIGLAAIHLTDSEALVYYVNSRYFSEAAAVGRLVRILMADSPPQIEKFRLIAIDGGVPQEEFEVLRGPMERSLDQEPGVNDGLLGGTITESAPPLNNPVLGYATRQQYPDFSWSIFPQFRQSLFDVSNPFQVQFLAGVAGTLQMLPGLSLSAEFEASLYDDFNTTLPNTSTLPHVRSDFSRFFSEGKNGMGDLEADYRFRPAPSVWAVARVGYLESMFAGAGGEVLWRPENQRWALGVDGYVVQQRNFDRLFGLQHYQVATGHITAYYQAPIYDLNFAISVGQYLAGDRGFTFAVTRRFASGVEIGAFMTKTNVSAEQFGEGSFDKGIIIRIPLGWALPIDSQGQLRLDLRPIQRDGGQRLLGDANLYDETRRTSEGEVLNHAPDFASP